MVRILIVAAYASVRAGLHALLAGTEDCEVIGEVRSATDLETAIPDARPDVVLFDDNPDDRDRVIRTVAEQEIGLLVLGESRTGPQRLAEATLPGWAYLLKEADSAEIAVAAQAVSVGLVVIDRALANEFGRGIIPERNVSSEIPPGETLTGREREVLQLLARGLPNKQIAARLQISTHTVKFHVASLLAKLGAASRTEAVTIGARRGDVLL